MNRKFEQKLFQFAFRNQTPSILRSREKREKNSSTTNTTNTTNQTTRVTTMKLYPSAPPLYPSPSAPPLHQAQPSSNNNNNNNNTQRQQTLQTNHHEKDVNHVPPSPNTPNTPNTSSNNNTIPPEFANIDQTKFHLHQLDKFNDSLTSLAILYGVHEEDIKRVNRFTDLDLYMKPYLIIPKIAVNQLLSRENCGETNELQSALDREAEKQRKLVERFSRVHTQIKSRDEARYYLSYNDWCLDRARNHLLSDLEWERQHLLNQEKHRIALQRYSGNNGGGSSSSSSSSSSSREAIPLIDRSNSGYRSVNNGDSSTLWIGDATTTTTMTTMMRRRVESSNNW